MLTPEEKLRRRRMVASSVTTIISIALVLFVLGLLGLILLHAQRLGNYVKENIGFSVMLKEDAKESSIFEFQKRLDIEPYVKSTRYVSKDEAAKELMEDLGEDFVGFLGYNPLSASIDIHLNADYANNDSIPAIEKKLNANPLVSEVSYQKSLVELINKNVRRISIVLLIFSAMLMLISIALINNTIRLSIYSKRFLIKTMQLVGATQNFIQKPFINKGLLHGFISALIAIVLLTVVLYFSRKELPELIDLQNLDMYLILFGMVVVLGLIISGISTYFAVRKFLRMRNDYLYY